MKEIWKPIEGFEKYYEVSNKGRIKSLFRRILTKNGVFKNKKESILKTTVSTSGYHSVMLCVNDVRSRFYVHRLVAKMFLPRLFENYVVNHKDGNKLNNNFSNLEWVSIQENVDHSIENGLTPQGEKSTSAKLSSKNVLVIRRLFKINPKFNRNEVSRKLGVSESTIRKIIFNQRWKHLNG